jgi:hypothetical protein
MIQWIHRTERIWQQKFYQETFLFHIDIWKCYFTTKYKIMYGFLFHIMHLFHVLIKSYHDTLLLSLEFGILGKKLGISLFSGIYDKYDVFSKYSKYQLIHLIYKILSYFPSPSSPPPPLPLPSPPPLLFLLPPSLPPSVFLCLLPWKSGHHQTIWIFSAQFCFLSGFMISQYPKSEDLMQFRIEAVLPDTS